MPELPAGTTRYEDVTPSHGLDAYHRCVLRVLLDSLGTPTTSMLCRPSFRPEYAVALIPPDDVEVAPDDWVRPDVPWTLTVATALVQGIQPAQPGGSWDALDADDFQVARSSIPIDAEIASEIEDACRMVVRRARHPRPEYMFDGERRLEASSTIRDGIRYELDAGGYHGTSHSPGPGPARDLIALLDQLASVVNLSSETERAAALRDCADRARTLRERAEQLPW